MYLFEIEAFSSIAVLQNKKHTPLPCKLLYVILKCTEIAIRFFSKWSQTRGEADVTLLRMCQSLPKRLKFNDTLSRTIH